MKHTASVTVGAGALVTVERDSGGRSLAFEVEQFAGLEVQLLWRQRRGPPWRAWFSLRTGQARELPGFRVLASDLQHLVAHQRARGVSFKRTAAPQRRKKAPGKPRQYPLFP